MSTEGVFSARDGKIGRVLSESRLSRNLSLSHRLPARNVWLRLGQSRHMREQWRIPMPLRRQGEASQNPECHSRRELCSQGRALVARVSGTSDQIRSASDKCLRPVAALKRALLDQYSRCCKSPDCNTVQALSSAKVCPTIALAWP
jgi:hypothetical protein